MGSKPPDGYTTVTIPEETAEKLASLMVNHDLTSMAAAITHAPEIAQVKDDTISDANLEGILLQ